MASRTAAFDANKIYVNGSRLSSSLLELQPFKVIPPEQKMESNSFSQNNNNHYKNRRTNSTPSYEEGGDGSLKSASVDTDKNLLLPNANQTATSASCGNLLESPTLRVKQNNIITPSRNHYGGRAASLDFEAHGKANGKNPTKPISRSSSREKLLANDSFRSQQGETKKSPPAKPNRESIRRSKQDIRHAGVQGSPSHKAVVNKNEESKVSTPQMPYHDYEELPSDVKIVQQRKIPPNHSENVQNHSVAPDIGFKPIAFQSPTSPAVPDRQRNPRQKQNPLYAGMHVNPYDACANAEVMDQRPPIKCFRCIVAAVIITFIFSTISVVAIALFIMGYLQPLDITKENGPDVSRNQLDAVSSIIYSQNQTISMLEKEIQMLRNKTDEANQAAEENLQSMKFELIEAVKNLNLTALKGPSTADVSRCIHESFGIGSSSSQNEIESGEYFAEKGHVTTGVTCSAPDGYVASLHSREEEADWIDENTEQLSRIYYNCKCRKSGTIRSASNVRIECRIHYWECPLL